MKYLCLVYCDEKTFQSMPAAEWEALNRECLSCGDALREGAYLLASEALQPVATATTVRVRSGKLSTTDGPFAETKEQLAGLPDRGARSQRGHSTGGKNSAGAVRQRGSTADPRCRSVS